MQKVKWGILSTARIGVEKVIPAIINGEGCEVSAIASRSFDKARTAADQLGIARAYGSYEELLQDPEIEAIYNPLPNHMHVPLSIQALEAGKHVLCEKPLALTVSETRDLIAARDRSGCLVVEAFMVRHHPQWQRARQILRSGKLGELRLIQSTFSFFNANPADIRNMPETGGGAIYDIGVYPITASRYFMGGEPRRVLGVMKFDPDFKTDILSSAILEYEDAMAVFSVSTQMVPYQRLHLFGSKGRLEFEIPYNSPPDQPAVFSFDDGSQLGGASALSESLPACDQYQLMAETFARNIRGLEQPEFPLEDSLAQMQIIEALFQSAKDGQWSVL